MDKKKHKSLMIGHYPIDKLDSAPKVRISHLYEQLKRKTNIDLITGFRSERRKELWKLLLSGKYKEYQWVYIEAATSTGIEIDFILLLLWKLIGVPTGIYIRDAYQLFDIPQEDNIKLRLLRYGWHISQFFYRHLSRIRFFPTRQLAAHFPGGVKALLPPGCRKPQPMNHQYHLKRSYILYSGTLNEDFGLSLLMESINLIRQDYPEVQLLLLSQSKLPEQWRDKSWIVHIQGTLEDIYNWSDQILCAIVPRPKTAYNDLALPIKLFDYVSLTHPIICTKTEAVEELLSPENIIIFVEANADAIKESCNELIQNAEKQRILRINAHQLAQGKMSWDARAQKLISIMEAST